MKGLDFYIVDVFAEKKYAGNQLAVFMNARGLTSRMMQAIARETHFSETTFILGQKPYLGGYDVRIFTPEEELPFAGHPTLGTAFVIQRSIIRRPVAKVVLNLKVGQIPVEFKDPGKKQDILWMKQLPPTFGKRFTAAKTARALGLDERDMDGRFPIQEVSTGVPFVIAPIRTLGAMRKIETDRAHFRTVLKGARARCILVFCAETYSRVNDLNVRMFAPLYGIPEDSATGSANGCLAGYLVEHRYFKRDRIDLRVEQGYEINRPSILYLKARKITRQIQVYVGGKVILVAEGKFF
jgi:trans-2,3-dihydro-3-hydroxyanthranilate isomerase